MRLHAPTRCNTFYARAPPRSLNLSVCDGERLIILEHVSAAVAELVLQLIASAARPLDLNGSSSDARMPLRVLGYEVRIWERHRP